MKRILLIAAVLISGLAYGETAQAKIDSLNALPNVLQANYLREPQSVPFFGELYTATIGWFYTENGIAKKSSADVIITALGTEQEASYWLAATPPILLPVVETKYITGRTGGGFTEAQVKSSVQAIWLNAVPTSSAIIGLTVSAVDGKTIRATGSFDVGNNLREIRTYVMWLVDVNGSVTPGNANIKWQRETVEAPAE
jgi:hypothetical protein